MNVTDRVCNLECVKDGTVHEFVGPVKIILVDPPEDQYNRRKAGAAFVAIANMMIGANTFLVLLFTMGYKLSFYNNLHIILCTFGYQFCMPSAILMLHALNGAAAPLKKSQRRREHIYLQLLGLACYLTGTVLIILYGQKSLFDYLVPSLESVHYYSGCVAGVISLTSMLIGPLIFLRKIELTTPSVLTFTHRMLGMLAFLSSSVCFLLGIVKPAFQIWLYIMAYMSPTYLMVFFTLFYTLVVLVTPASKFISKQKK